MRYEKSRKANIGISGSLKNAPAYAGEPRSKQPSYAQSGRHKSSQDIGMKKQNVLPLKRQFNMNKHEAGTSKALKKKTVALI
ncbi:MAG TPA: hypothetical protein ENN22_08335 [bacterium]|nr:hypothetical protein [bacterium]